MSSEILGNIYHKNRILKSCLNYLNIEEDHYVNSMLNNSYFHPGGVNYCVLQHKKGKNNR